MVPAAALRGCSEARPDVVLNLRHAIGEESAGSGVVNVQDVPAEIGEDAVEDPGGRINTGYEGPGGGAVAARANVGGIVDFEVGDRRVAYAQTVGLTVPLAAVVLPVRRLQDEPELVLAAIALVNVEVVVVAEEACHVFRVHGATEELTGIIGGAENLDVLNDGAAADGAERQSVDFLVRQNHRGGVADRDETEDARAVVVVTAAETVNELTVNLGVGQAFKDVVLGGRGVASDVAGCVQHALAKEDHAAPQTALPQGKIVGIVQVVTFRTKDDGAVLGAVGEDFGSLCDEQRTGTKAGAGLAANRGARFDV